MASNARPKIYAVDFDGTLCSNKFPEIGEPNWELIANLKQKKTEGHKLILYSMREGEILQNAVDACKSWGLEFDAVNDNLSDMIEAFKNNPRKIFANVYIDDHNAKGNNVFTNLPYIPYETVS